MKKNILKGIGYFLSLMLVTQSCRTESLVSEQENQPKYNYNISILDKEQVESKLPLLLEVNKLKTNFFKPVTTTGKTTEPQDPILDGAIIETDRVLEITSGSDRTYTFPVSRTFSNDKIENLVLRENSDNTYSGVLIQYSLNKQEKELYTSGAKVDLTGKIKVYSINNLSITGKGTYSFYDGC